MSGHYWDFLHPWGVKPYRRRTASPTWISVDFGKLEAMTQLLVETHDMNETARECVYHACGIDHLLPQSREL